MNHTVDHDTIKKQTAIVILAFADYESLELSLATHARFSVPAGVPIFILQNGHGTYDNERTYSVAKRYQELFPETVKVVDHFPQQEPYLSIQELLNDPLLSDYQYIIKLDDDMMVLTPDWIDKLIDCYVQSYMQVGEELAYVTSLINNNPYGFKKLLDLNATLAEEYYSQLSRTHLIGCWPDDSWNPYRIIPADSIYDGGYGTIWHLPYVARWLHEKTTLQPEEYIAFTKDRGIEEVDTRKRYSIGCILFRKDLWAAIDDGTADDEQSLYVYCMSNRKKIYANLSVPMVHIAFYSQREEIRDLIPKIREVYTAYLSLCFPIAICSDRMIEIENRLRFMEKNCLRELSSISRKKTLADKLHGGVQCYRDHGALYTLRRALYHIGLWKDEEASGS